jgi:DNA-binding LacI/PurR family transcriptional regulator
LSPMTASRALRRLESVSGELRARINAAVERPGHAPYAPQASWRRREPG